MCSNDPHCVSYKICLWCKGTDESKGFYTKSTCKRLCHVLLYIELQCDMKSNRISGLPHEVYSGSTIFIYFLLNFSWTAVLLNFNLFLIQRLKGSAWLHIFKVTLCLSNEIHWSIPIMLKFLQGELRHFCGAVLYNLLHSLHTLHSALLVSGEVGWSCAVSHFYQFMPCHMLHSKLFWLCSIITYCEAVSAWNLPLQMLAFA